MRLIGKRILVVTLVLFLFLLSISVVTAATYGNNVVRASLQSQTPDPVEPGEIVTVKFKIENTAGETYEDVIVKLLPKFPFKLYGDVAEKNLGKLKVGSGADAVIVEYKLKVDENAVEGDTELELQVNVGAGGLSYTNDELLIHINSRNPVLDITSIDFTPQQVAPGETSLINVNVKNTAESPLKNIRFKLDFTDEDLPLAPYQSSSERRLTQLASGLEDSLQFRIIADPDAVSGLYKIPLNITYEDEDGNPLSYDDVLGVSVGEEPQVRTYIKRSTSLRANEPSKITLEIANAGTTDVKFFEISLLPWEDYQLISASDYIYIGDIDSDDTESEDIDIFINRKADDDGKLTIPVKLSYYDANNIKYEKNFNLEMELYSSWKLKKFGVLQRNYSWIYLLVLILALGGFLYYKDYFEFRRRLKSVVEKLSFWKKKKKKR